MRLDTYWGVVFWSVVFVLSFGIRTVVRYILFNVDYREWLVAKIIICGIMIIALHVIFIVNII